METLSKFNVCLTYDVGMTITNVTLTPRQGRVCAILSIYIYDVIDL